MATRTRRESWDVQVLRNVPYPVYAQLVEDPVNFHLRMAYHDGTLEIVSPIKSKHERPSRRIGIIVTTVAKALGMAYEGMDKTTFKREGPGPTQGVGKEPDQAFYLQSVTRMPLDREVDLNAGDPPPDLWIEVDNRVSSSGRLPVYAKLGVPEVWQYRTRSGSLRFLGLAEGGYVPIERSIALPVLTPVRVLEALALGQGLLLYESAWFELLRPWAARLVADAT